MFPQFHFKFSLSDDIAASVKKNSHSLLIYIHSMSLDIFLVEGESKCHFLCDIKIISNTFMFIYFLDIFFSFLVFFVLLLRNEIVSFVDVRCLYPVSLFFSAFKNIVNEFIDRDVLSCFE